MFKNRGFTTIMMHDIEYITASLVTVSHGISMLRLFQEVWNEDRLLVKVVELKAAGC